MPIYQNCEKCKWSIFDPVWGEYKCKKKQRYIYEHYDYECDAFEAKDDKSKES